MRNLVIAFSVLFCVATIALAHSYFGSPLELDRDLKGNVKELAMSYVYGSAWGWSLRFKPLISAESIALLPAQITVRLVSGGTGTEFYEMVIDKSKLGFIDIFVHDRSVLERFLPVQRHAVVTFSGADDKALFYFPIGEICSKYRDHVTNMSRPGNEACAVNPEEFLTDGKICENKKLNLLQALKDDYLKCSAAQEIFTKAQCGELECTL